MKPKKKILQGYSKVTEYMEPVITQTDNLLNKQTNKTQNYI